MAISGAYFDVLLIGTGVVLAGGFSSVSGLDMEVDLSLIHIFPLGAAVSRSAGIHGNYYITANKKIARCP